MTIQTAVLIETLIALGAEVTSLVTFSLLKIKLLLHCCCWNSGLCLERIERRGF
jgi:hypothetical protein